MSTKGEITESTIARIAGNILSGTLDVDPERQQANVVEAVRTARAIAAEVRRTTRPNDCIMHGCAVNVHAPGCGHYAAQMSVGLTGDME